MKVSREEVPGRAAGIDNQRVESPKLSDGTVDGEPRLLGICDVRDGRDDAASVSAYGFAGSLQRRV
jgi:hypothetical protein